MRIYSLQHRAKFYPFVYLVILLTALGNSFLLFAHSGTPASAPTKVPTTITINGTIDSSGAEAVWAPGQQIGTIPNNCSEFNGMPPAPPVTLFALNDGTNLYMALDIPDTSANATDALFLAFDPNHSGGGTPAAGDQALLLTFNNTAASDAVPAAQSYTGTGAGWSAAPPGLPAGVAAKYTRITAGTGKWQIEMRFPYTGPTVGLALLYMNETGALGIDCNSDGIDDDFYARFPSTLTISNPISLPSGIANPSVWGNLDFGPQPPTVGFQAPLCCSSSDITYTPATQPFTAGVPVNINATVHNLHATSTANNVNVEIRVHNFGTGGGVIAPFPLATQVPAIAPLGSASGSAVTWPSPPAGLHGCIRAEIKPPTTSQYFIASGAEIAQHNIDVACIPRGMSMPLRFMTYNPEEKDQAVKIILAKEVLLPDGFKGLTFDIKQPDRPLRAREEFPVEMIVTADATTPLTNVPKQTVQVPPTAGGPASPLVRERTGTDPVTVKVRPGDRLHFTASGEVDIDGGGAIPASGPDGQDVANMIRERQPFLLRSESASNYGGALIGSFDNFASSFVIGKEVTFTVPDKVEELRLAVNDFDAGYADNTGKGFDVEVATLPAFTVEARPVLPSALMADPVKVALPQVNITATSTARVNVGEVSYDLLTNHGGVTYQFLVIDDGRHAAGEAAAPSKYGLSKPVLYGLLALLVIIVLFILVRIFARRKRVS
jgi:hypothetical protein